MSKDIIRLSGVIKNSIVDGPGFRLTVFCQGCPHHCEGCHNEKTWDFDGGFDGKPAAFARLRVETDGKAFMQVLVTPLGMMKLAQKLEIAV